MTNEEQIEEILWEAHAHGIRNEVMAEAIKLMVLNPKLGRLQAYEQVLNKYI
jgi:hypothetical protein|tara:strand:+ start:73 stop:228 length:156 start_codon:yes stop_codon:yes gene_type:complete